MNFETELFENYYNFAIIEIAKIIYNKDNIEKSIENLEIMIKELIQAEKPVIHNVMFLKMIEKYIESIEYKKLAEKYIQLIKEEANK